MEVTCDPSLETNQVAVWFLVVASTKTQNNWREITRFSKQLGSLLSLETDVFVGLRSPGQANLRFHEIMMWARLCEILWTNGVIKWGNEIRLDLKTVMML